MELQVKLKKTTEITYLETSQQQTGFHLTYLDVLK